MPSRLSSSCSGKRRRAEARARLLLLMSRDRAAHGEIDLSTEAEINCTLPGLEENSDCKLAFTGVVDLQLVGSPPP